MTEELDSIRSAIDESIGCLTKLRDGVDDLIDTDSSKFTELLIATLIMLESVKNLERIKSGVEGRPEEGEVDEKTPTIREMLEKHPEIEYISLIWIWEDDPCDSRFIRVKNRLPARPLYMIDRLDYVYSYVGPYISDEDKAAFLQWIDDYGMDDRFRDLYVGCMNIIGDSRDYGIDVTCLCGEIRDSSGNCGRDWASDFEFIDVEKFVGQYLDAIYDEETHELLSGRSKK